MPNLHLCIGSAVSYHFDFVSRSHLLLTSLVLILTWTKSHTAIGLSLVSILGVLEAYHLLIQDPRLNKLVPLSLGLCDEKLRSLLLLFDSLFHTEAAFDLVIFGVWESCDLGRLNIAQTEYLLGSERFLIWQNIQVVLNSSLDVCLWFDEVVKNHICV